MSNVNIGNAFPLEKLDSDISRNNYNYQSILNGLVKWNNSSDDSVVIRLTKDSAPWFEDYVIPSRKSTLNVDTFKTDILNTINAHSFAYEYPIDCVVYGGSKQFKSSTFNSDGYTSSPSANIVLIDAINFSIGDPVLFRSQSGSIPTAISNHILYYIVSKLGNVITVSDTPSGTGVTLNDGSGDITLYKFESSPETNDTDQGDIVTFRTTVFSAGNCNWRLYYVPSIYTFISGNTYNAGNYVSDGTYIYRVITNSIPTDAINYTNVFRPLITNWVYDNEYFAGDLIIYDSIVYKCVIDVSSSIVTPNNDSDYFELYSPSWIAGSDYAEGAYVYYNNKFYVCTHTILSSTLAPNLDTSNWEEKLLFKIDSIGNISKSGIARWYVTCDSIQLYFRNESDSSSLDNTNIHAQLSVKSVEPISIYQKNVGVVPTSNYLMWPENQTLVWSSSSAYGPTDTSIPISKRQSYSASMIYDHTRPDLAKTVNFVNYDGPDLDQGLCIYLPVEVEVGDDGIAYPEDGFTYEFFFRIWPNAQLNGSTTRDHTVNKSQIYVYSVINRDSIADDICENPIAKFSMARTTNFYMFGENVSIPDKPVCYRVTFIYSAEEKRWMVLDYYQLPDHIFVGPVGFIDPQSPSNPDINNELMGINPNASFIGYETAAFPLFQDPFSDTNLSPYRFNTDDDYTNFKNRMI